MDNLYIDYEQGHILGTKIQSESKELIVLLNKLNTIQEKLKNNVNIDEKCTKELLTRTKIMFKLADIVSETGDFLVNVSNAYRVTEQVGENIMIQEEVF